MNYNALVAQWKDSLKLFHKANLSLYFLGCLNTMKLSGTLMVKYFWWAFLALACLHIGHLPKIHGAIPNLATNLTILLHIILLFAYIMSMRPSIEPKAPNYYLAYVPALWAVAVTYLLVGPYLLPLAAIVLLFFFDSSLGLADYGAAWIRTGKLFFYLLPAIAIVMTAKIILNVIWYWATYKLDAFLPGISIPLLALIHLFNYASLTVFYIRAKHNHFNLIFE